MPLPTINTIITYRNDMKFEIAGQAIPDPAVFSGKESDLDTLGKRNAHGTLKRNLVATKHPIKMEYTAIEWSMIQYILSLMTTVDASGKRISKSHFQFTYPDPATGQNVTRKCYVGDRDWDCTFVTQASVNGQAKSNVYIGSLKFSIIEI